MPQLAVAAAGAAIGSTIGGTFLGMSAAAIGWGVGSVVGSMLFAPETHGQGARLNDLKVGQVAYGSTIPYIEGHPRVAGIVVWASEKREIATVTESGGKGGGSSYTSYSYEIDVLLMLSENPVQSLRRIWMNGELIYSRHQDSDADVFEAEQERWNRLTYYPGDADQMPDPVYEAAVGVGNAPAYRGRSTVFMEGLQLGSSGQLPNFTFELMPAPSEDADPISGAKRIFAAESDGTFTTHPPQGAYVGGANLAVAQAKPTVVEHRTKAGAVSLIETPQAALTSSPGRGNADRALVGFGSAAQDRGIPIVYLVGEGISLTLNIPDTTDHLGNASLRYSMYGTRVAVASSLALGTGAGEYYLAEGAKGRVYVFSISGAHQATIAHGAPVTSLAMTAGGVYVLSGTTLSFYSATGWSLAGTVALPDGTGHVVFTSLEGLLCCAGSAGQVWRYVEDEWNLLAVMASGETALGTSTSRHAVSYDYAYAAKLKPGTVPVTRLHWIDSTVNDPIPLSAVYSTLEECAAEMLRRWAVFYYFHPTITNDVRKRPVRNAYYVLGTVVTMTPAFKNPYWLTHQCPVVLWAERYYGYPGDAQTGWFWASSGSTELIVGTQLGAFTGSELEVYRALNYDAVPESEPTLQEVVERQCERAGLPLEYVDASALSEQRVRAMALSQVSSPRQVIEVLSGAYHFSAVESDILRFRPRGAGPVASIAYDDLVAAGEGEALPIIKANDLELPVQVVVKFSNVLDDYQDGAEHSDRLVSSGDNTVVVEIPLGMTPTEAKRVADVAVFDAAASSLRFGPFALDRGYSRLEPADIITVQDQAGNSYRVRLTKKTESGGVLTFEGVSDDAVAVQSAALSDSTGYQNSIGIRLPVDTLLQLVDAPLVTDDDDGPGAYALAKPSRDVVYPGAVLFDSPDDVTFSPRESLGEAVFGTASTVLPTGPLGVFDEGSSVTVDVGFGELASTTRESLLASRTLNLLMVGSEVIQFRTATLLSVGVYRLTGLLRGLRGTEWARSTHAANEPVALLSRASRIPLSNVDLGVARFYKGVTSGRTTATAPTEALTVSGVSLKPYAPVDVRVMREAADVQITWQRRTRLASRLIGSLGISVPLGEESERYAVEIYSGSTYATVVRTITTTTASLIYSEAEQIADFGTPPATIYLRVYQISATVGRGYAATAQG
jgi:hypothetical protein